jgi:diaminopimelate decarboxylase
MFALSVYPEGYSHTMSDRLISRIDRIAQEIDTPFYIYFPDQIRVAFERFRAGLAGWGEGRIAYSLKTNPFWKLLADVRGLGCCAEVVSEWEYRLATYAGFPPTSIIFNGPLKPLSAIQFAADSGVLTLNIDSLDELERIYEYSVRTKKRFSIGVRLCPDSRGYASSRFGLQAETGEVDAAIEKIMSHNLFRLQCIHFHLGTQLQTPDPHLEALRLAQRCWETFDLKENVFLDVGGGFPYSHDVSLAAQSFEPEDFFSELRQSWGYRVVPPIIVEPGRWISASAFGVVSRVLSCKPRKSEPSIIVLDSGTNHNVMGAFYDHSWVFLESATERSSFRFCGPLCMEDDILSGEIVGEPPRVGSLAMMMNAGAYSFSLSRSFIQARPPVVQLCQDGDYQILTPREEPATAYGTKDDPFCASHAIQESLDVSGSKT